MESPPKPFEKEEILTRDQWKSMVTPFSEPQFRNMVKSWNERLGLMDSVRDGIDIKKIPSRLPYRNIDNAPELVSVDSLFFDRIKNTKVGLLL